jgi:hypothetical protein
MIEASESPPLALAHKGLPVETISRRFIEKEVIARSPLIETRST